jgi:hypothetical protein
MIQSYRFSSGELAPNLVLPPEIQRGLRLLLATIESACSPVNCLIAQANAHGVCLGLDIGHVIARSDIERVEILIDNTATQRMAELADVTLLN